jgi:hypothetical protein
MSFASEAVWYRNTASSTPLSFQTVGR